MAKAPSFLDFRSLKDKEDVIDMARGRLGNTENKQPYLLAFTCPKNAVDILNNTYRLNRVNPSSMPGELLDYFKTHTVMGIWHNGSSLILQAIQDDNLGHLPAMYINKANSVRANIFVFGEEFKSSGFYSDLRKLGPTNSGMIGQ